jgi:hypothetical protein
MTPKYPDEDLNILYIEYNYDDWDDEEGAREDNPDPEWDDPEFEDA